MTDTKLTYSIDEAATRVGICRDRIYSAIKDGRLDAKKAGRRTLVTAEALHRFIEALPALKLPQGGAG
jgi:excisionase family DNA binding protein